MVKTMKKIIASTTFWDKYDNYLKSMGVMQ